MVVEGYYIELKCYVNFEFHNEVRLVTSKFSYLYEVHKKLRAKCSVVQDGQSRLWVSRSGGKFELVDLNGTVGDAGIKTKQCVVLEVQRDGKWLPISKLIASESLASAYVKNKNDLSKEAPSAANRESSKHVPGVCGLVNLGNTCYMNSVLQCLSNCPQLTEYFLGNHHLSEMNTVNPLGMSGEMARVYGELLRTMWSGESSFVKPLQFKAQVGRFNSQFRGWGQHDAQELLTFLLDGLHEDLNRAKRSYKEQPKQGEVNGGKESWDQYKSRNDSVIFDIFHGLLKSRVICPQCERLSVTYDPFCSLSLPLPLKNDRFVRVHFIPCDPSKTSTTLKIIVPVKGSIRDICKEVAVKTDTSPSLLVPAEISDFHFHKFYTQEENISVIEDKQLIFVYELPAMANETDHTVVPVCFWDLTQSKVKHSLKHGLGIPLILLISKCDLRNRRLGFFLLNYVKKRFKLPVDNLKSGLNVYLVEFGNKDNVDSVKLEFNESGECKEDIYELLEVGNTNRIFGRKMLIVDLAEKYSQLFSSNDDTETFDKLNFNEPSKLQIYDCIDLFASCEKLCSENAWYCPTCAKHQRATKKFDLWKLPLILIVHLKRFSYLRDGDKLDTAVHYPLTGLNLCGYTVNPGEREVTYDLIAVVNHYGTMSGGHYTASCRNKENGLWYCFNDNTVSQMDPQQVVSRNAYVLFYKKKDQ